MYSDNLIDEINNDLVMKLWRYSGFFLTATGVIHVVFALTAYWSSYSALFSDGLVNSLGEDLQKNLAFWFILVGVLLLMFGQSLQHYIKKEGMPAPLSLGYALLVFSVFGCFVVPASGFWLFIPQALIIILAKRTNCQSES